jgi:hypothetical protein
LSVKYPVRNIQIISNPELLKGIENLATYIATEINAENIQLVPDTGLYSEKILIVEHKTAGKIYGKEFKKFQEVIKTIP